MFTPSFERMTVKIAAKLSMPGLPLLLAPINPTNSPVATLNSASRSWDGDDDVVERRLSEAIESQGRHSNPTLGSD
jgi:hypothetical protein